MNISISLDYLWWLLYFGEKCDWLLLFCVGMVMLWWHMFFGKHSCQLMNDLLQKHNYGSILKNYSFHKYLSKIIFQHSITYSLKGKRNIHIYKINSNNNNNSDWSWTKLVNHILFYFRNLVKNTTLLQETLAQISLFYMFIMTFQLIF